MKKIIVRLMKIPLIFWYGRLINLYFIAAIHLTKVWQFACVPVSLRCLCCSLYLLAYVPWREWFNERDASSKDHMWHVSEAINSSSLDCAIWKMNKEYSWTERVAINDNIKKLFYSCFSVFFATCWLLKGCMKFDMSFNSINQSNHSMQSTSKGFHNFFIV